MSNAKANGLLSIPAASRRMVQSLMEIVNCPEHEIYAMLKECNMDPNDTVNRLLSQDTFHEVKSKREKKKELKEASDSWSRCASSSSSRGSRNASNHNIGRSVSTQFNSAESGVIRGRAASKKENGSNAIPTSSPAFITVGNHANRGSVTSFSACFSESVPMEAAVQAVGPADTSLPSQPSSGFQPAWLGAHGQVSMAEIVKMGRPRQRASNPPVITTDASYSPNNAVMLNAPRQSVNPPAYLLQTSESYHELHSSQVPVSKVSEINHEHTIGINQDVSHDEWPLAEPSAKPSILEPSGSSAVYTDPSSHIDEDDWHLTSDEAQFREGHVLSEKMGAGCMGSASASDGHMHMKSSAGAPHFDDATSESRSSNQPERLVLEHQEESGSPPRLSLTDFSIPSSSGDISIAVSSAAASLQHLKLHKEEADAPSLENNPAVIIPTHLQVSTADCSHLSFGSFGSGLSAPFSGSLTTKNLKSNLEDASVPFNISSAGASSEQIDTRNAENYAIELTSSSNEIEDSASSSQPEVVRHDNIMEASQGHHYPFSSVSGYSYEDTARTNANSLPNAQANIEMLNNSPLSSVMQPNVPTNLVPSSLQHLRESDIRYLPFLTTQSPPTSSSASSINGPAMSMPEALKSSFSGQPIPQPMPSTNIPIGPAAAQHLPVHPFSQPTLPLGHFASIYPFLPPSYTYLPSAFQQAYAGSSAFHQPAAAVHGSMKYSLPQYKNSISVSSLAPSASVASAYGGFGSSANIPNNISLDPSTNSPSTTVGYEDLMSPQYKESNLYAPLQQNETSRRWIHGAGSRAISVLPASSYYSLQSQNQNGAYRQVQQPSHYGSLGYPAFYHSRTAASQERHQLQGDGGLNATQAQGHPSQPSHQIWQHNY